MPWIRKGIKNCLNDMVRVTCLSHLFFWKILIFQHKILYWKSFLSIIGFGKLVAQHSTWLFVYNCILLKNWDGFQSFPKSFRFFIDKHVSIISSNLIMLPILNSCLVVYFFFHPFYSFQSCSNSLCQENWWKFSERIASPLNLRR